MTNLNLFEEKIINVGEKTKYYVIKQTVYKENLYLLANELIDEETPSDTIAILRVDNKEDDLMIALEKDEKILNELLNIFSELI